MAYTVTELITRAYYLTGIVSREFETVSGPQFADGLNTLNDVIEDKTSEKSMIPYFTSANFLTVIGQEPYFIPNLVEVTTLVFFLATVRYAMIPVDRDQYFGYPRAESIESLPFNYHVERGFNTNPLLGAIGEGATIYLYFLPQAVYTMQLWGKFALSKVELNQDLELTVPRFYINYLKYALAQRLCDNFGYDVPSRIAQQLEEYELQIAKKSGPLDLKMKKLSTLDGLATGLNYAQVNLGKGWTVP